VDDEEDSAPRESSVPSGPKEGERAKWGGSEVPSQPVVPEGPTEPRPAFGAEAGGSVEVPRAETTVEAPAPTAGEMGVHPMAPGTSRGPQGAPSSQKKAAPEQGMYRFSNFSSDFLFFSFF